MPLVDAGDRRKLYYVCEDKITSSIRMRMLKCEPNEVIRAVFMEDKAGIVEPFTSKHLLQINYLCGFLYLDCFNLKVMKIFF